MAIRYKYGLLALRIIVLAAFITSFCIALEVWGAARRNESRMLRQIEYLSTVCPELQGGRALVSSIQRIERGLDGGVAPISLTCVYTAPLYGQSTRRNLRQFQ